MDPEMVEQILRSHFFGKRDAYRTSTMLDIVVEGRNGSFRGTAVNISRTGILLRILDPDFADPSEIGQLMPYTARVWHHFDSGLHVRSPGNGLATPADVVRVTGYSGRGKSIILIGCRFRRPLAEDLCEKLGVDPGDDRPPLP